MDEMDDEQSQYAQTFEAMQRIWLSIEELWIYYLSMGGSIDEYEVNAYLNGVTRLPRIDRDMISQSVNEMQDDICRAPRAPFSSTPGNMFDDARIQSLPDIPVNVGRETLGDTGGVRAIDDDNRSVVRKGSGGVEDKSRLDETDYSTVATTAQEPCLSIVYASTATRSFTSEDLSALLTQSRRTNNRLQLTGLLLYRQGRFLQVLEGPEALVRDRIATITADLRHKDLRILIEETRQQRQFPDWTMGYEPISSTMPEEVPGYERPFEEQEDDMNPDETVRVLRDLVHWFQERAIPLR